MTGFFHLNGARSDPQGAGLWDPSYVASTPGVSPRRATTHYAG
jgi:hypothetical protein